MTAPGRVPDSAAEVRRTEATVDPQFTGRWSPRAFRPDPLAPEQIASLFEAARWAPSCFNDQPWLFVYGTKVEDRQRIAAVLVEANRAWAGRAPLLGVVFARLRFAHNDQPNRWGPFDAGAAALSLSLQANKLGLHSHFMGGFDQDKAHEALQVPKSDYLALAAFVVGRRADPAELPEPYREREKPSGRKPLSEVAREGVFR